MIAMMKLVNQNKEDFHSIKNELGSKTIEIMKIYKLKGHGQVNNRSEIT